MLNHSELIFVTVLFLQTKAIVSKTREENSLIHTTTTLIDSCTGKLDSLCFILNSVRGNKLLKPLEIAIHLRSGNECRHQNYTPT